MSDNQPLNLRISTQELAKLEKDIVSWDEKLERAQTHFQDNLMIYDFIGNARDCLFQLSQALHGCNIVDFSRSHEDTFWASEWLEEQQQRQQEAEGAS